MAFEGLDDYISAAKQQIRWAKTGTRTTIAGAWFSVFDVAGNPGAGTLAGTSTAAGVVPTDATAGCPLIDAFGGSAVGIVACVDFSSSVACRISIYDLLFKAGAYSYNANTALSGQPSFAARVPGGLYTGLQIWVEQVTVATGNQAVNVTYTNESGVGSHTTGAVGIGAAPTVGRCWQLPLQSGDSGVQLITNVQGSVATVGTFNVLVLRRLWSGRVRSANDGDNHGIDRTGLPDFFETSAIYGLVATDSTALGLPELAIEIANH